MPLPINRNTLAPLRKGNLPRVKTSSELPQGINKFKYHVNDVDIKKPITTDPHDVLKQDIKKRESHFEHEIGVIHNIGAVLGHLFDLLNNLVTSIIEFLVALFLPGEDSRAAGGEMTKQLNDLLYKDNKVIYSILLGGLLTILLTIIVPLVWRLAKQRVVRAFISFGHSMEEIAEFLERELKAKRIIVTRLPYNKNAKHQEIVDPVLNQISKCDAFLCIPGQTASFVESEVLAASVTKKIIFFLTRECQGTLPNTADKRYPVFKLEKVKQDKFASCIDFLEYCACDFRSTLDLLGKSLSMTVRVICKKKTMIIYLLGLSLLFSVWSSRIVESAAFLKILNPEFKDVSTVVLTWFFIVFGIIIAAALSILFCSLSFLFSIINRINIQRRIRLRVGLGQFQRKEWIGLAPGLLPGEILYDSLFEISPPAHHEKN